MYKSNNFIGWRYSEKIQYLCQCTDRTVLRDLGTSVANGSLLCRENETLRAIWSSRDVFWHEQSMNWDNLDGQPWRLPSQCLIRLLLRSHIDVDFLCCENDTIKQYDEKWKCVKKKCTLGSLKWFWCLPYFIRPITFPLWKKKKEQLEILIIYDVKNFDQIYIDKGHPHTFFFIQFLFRNNALESHRAKHFTPLPFISHFVCFYSCTYVVGLRVFGICSVTPFFEWTVLGGRPAFPVWDS